MTMVRQTNQSKTAANPRPIRQPVTSRTWGSQSRMMGTRRKPTRLTATKGCALWSSTDTKSEAALKQKESAHRIMETSPAISVPLVNQGAIAQTKAAGKARAATKKAILRVATTKAGVVYFIAFKKLTCLRPRTSSVERRRKVVSTAL